MQPNTDIAHPDKGDPGEISLDWKNAFGLQDDIFFTCFWAGMVSVVRMLINQLEQSIKLVFSLGA